jgi:iron(III) transport system substrate-binding protein
MSGYAPVPRVVRGTFFSAAARVLLFSLVVTLVSQGPAAAQDDFEQKWQALIQAAQKEGELSVLFGGEAGRIFGPPLRYFGNKFGIRVIAPPGNGTALSNRVLAERQAGRYTADIIHMSLTSVFGRLVPAGILDDLRPELIHPEVTNESLWYGGHYWWADPDRKFYFIYAARQKPSLEVNYNTNAVTEADVGSVSSVWDFLDDRWKGKFVTLPPTNGGGGAGWATQYFSPYMGTEWLTRFITKMNVNFVNDVRQIVDGLATGRYAATINVDARGDMEAMAARGMPIAPFDKQLKEPNFMSSSGQGMFGVAVNRPHPNAARLFVNWLLSREGQTIRQGIPTEATIQSLREDDIPLGKTRKNELRVAGVDYWFPMADSNFIQGMEEARRWTVKVYRNSR